MAGMDPQKLLAYNLAVASGDPYKIAKATADLTAQSGPTYTPGDIASAISGILGAGTQAYTTILTAQLRAKQDAGIDITAALRDRNKLAQELQEAKWRAEHAGTGSNIPWTWIGIGAAVLLAGYFFMRKR
jgi:LPXTG-motif cell wall-anchored protein